MLEGSFEYGEESFDIGLCVLSGQAFRWRQVSDELHGFIGNRFARLRRTGKTVHFAVNGSANVVRDYFRLEDDLGDIHERLLAAEPKLALRMRRFRGLRVLCWPDPEECLFSFLCTPNNNIPRITGMISRLCERFGPEIENGRGFPCADAIAAVPEAELRALGFGYRARTIKHVAVELLSRKEGWLDALKHVSYDHAHEQLMSLPGVGPKVADCVCLFGLHHLAAVPVDTHLWQAVGAWVLPDLAGKSLTPQRYRRVGDYFRDRFGELAGWAHQYLFYAHLAGER